MTFIWEDIDMKTIIVSGIAYIDIDALACAIAYKDFLYLKGQKSYAVLSDKLTVSITDAVKKRWYVIDEEQISKDDKVIVVDTSCPESIQEEVNQENIIEVFDHHAGHEKYWEDKLWNKAHIEYIWACATLIYEQIEKEHLTEKLSMASINLLYTAILSNTLYLRAHITHERDRIAFERLQKLSDLPNDWPEIYFEDLQKDVYKDPLTLLANDTKIADIGGIKIPITQVELRDTKDFSTKHNDMIVKHLQSYNMENWLYTAPSISENKNYLICSSKELQQALNKDIWATFTGIVGETSELWLRKEIMKNLMDINF